MKRYRVITYDFDTRANILKQKIQKNWEENIKKACINNKRIIKEGIIAEYGTVRAFDKIENFITLGANPISIIAFHNKFLHQIESAFIIGSYYPALTATCTLGERILNHLILKLKKHFTKTKEYKKIYNKNSFNNWDIAINTLEAWEVLLPKVIIAFRELKKIRNKSIHFNPETDSNDKGLALEAILKLKEIVNEQFSGFGGQTWFIKGIKRGCFIKHDSENIPFVKEIVIPNCVKVGHLHKLERIHNKWIVNDEENYADIEISDERFTELVNNPKKYDINNNEIKSNINCNS